MPRLLFFMLVASPLFASPDGDPPPIKLGPATTHQVRFVQTVSCVSPSGRGRLEALEIRVALPRSGPRQKVLSLEYSRTPDRFLEDRHGNTFAVFDRERLPAGGTISVGWTARVLTRQVVHSIDAGSLRPLATCPEDIRKTYLRPGEVYSMDDPAVRKAATEAARGARNPLDLAFRINEYVRRKLRYVNDGRWDTAATVLRNGTGSCSEYGFLFIALCRLNGLPARFVGATALREDGERYVDRIHHRWSEVYLPGHGWYPVDVSRNDGEDQRTINRFFGRTSDRLLVLMRGDGGGNAPLGWGYVSEVRAVRRADAGLRRSKRFIWTKPLGETPASYVQKTP